MNNRQYMYELNDLKLMLKYWKEYCEYCECLYRQNKEKKLGK